MVGGEARGRPLLTPARSGVRPTTALVRRALFDIVGPGIVGAFVLDGYAGVGGLGLEALSRGAGSVTFVERERVPLECLRANLDHLGYAGRATVVAAAVRPWLARHPVGGFQLVVCDPPYGDRAPTPAETPEAVLVLAAIAANLDRDGAGGTAPGPLVVLEHPRRVALPERAGTLACTRAARYGTTMLSFYRRAR